MAATDQRHRRATLAALRARVARIERSGAAQPAGNVSLCKAIDDGLPGSGLARAAIHEVLAADAGAVVGFCALILARTSGAVVWIGADPDIWPDGLTAFGLSAGELVLVGAKRRKDGLWALEEALRSPCVSGAVLVVDGHAPNLVAARRLQLAAEAGGGIGVLLLADTDRASPSAAKSRWRVGAAPGQRSGDPCWRLTLLRGSGGRPAEWTVVWDRAAKQLAVTPKPTRRRSAAMPPTAPG